MSLEPTVGSLGKNVFLLQKYSFKLLPRPPPYFLSNSRTKLLCFDEGKKKKKYWVGNQCIKALSFSYLPLFPSV